MSETSVARASLSKYCMGNGIDIGYGGDPIIPSAITLDQLKPYNWVGKAPQNLVGDCKDLYWFKDGVMDFCYCLPADSPILTREGVKNISSLTEFDEIYSHGGEWRKIKKVHKKQYDEKLIEIQIFGNGLPFRGTPEHKILINREGKDIFLPLSDIKKGDYAVVPFSSVTEDIDTLDLLSFLPSNPLYDEVMSLYKKRIFTIDHLAKKLNISRTTIHQWVTKSRTPYNVFRTENNFIISDGNTKPIPRYIKLDSDFLRLIGYYISDGCSSGNSISFYFSKHENKYYNDVIELMNKFFNSSPIKDKEKKNMSFIRYVSKPTAQIFRVLGGNPKQKHILSLLMTLPIEKQLGLLTGLISGDGTVSKKSKSASYSTASLYLAWQVRELFLRQGWLVGISKVKQEVVFDNRKVSSEIYNVYINGKEVEIVSDLTGKGTKSIGKKHNVRKIKFRFIKENKLYLKIKNKNYVTYNGNVHDITIDGNTDNEHTYTAYGILSHNSSHLLEDFYEDEIKQILKEWWRVLKIGGYLILYCPVERVFREHCRKTGQEYNLAHKLEQFDLEYIKKILNELGFPMLVVHEVPLVNTYSFELVIKKLGNIKLDEWFCEKIEV